MGNEAKDTMTGAAMGTAVMPGWGTLIGGGIGLGYSLGEDLGLWGGDDTPKPITNPYQGDWDALIKQLQARASGQGPSLAEQQYKQAFGQGMSQLSGQAHSGSQADAYNATRAMGQMSMGMGQGVAQARLQEQLAAQQQLMSALGGASGAWMQPQALQMQQQQLQQQQAMQQMQAYATLAAGLGRLGAGSGGGGTAPGYTQTGYIDQDNPIDNFQDARLGGF